LPEYTIYLTDDPKTVRTKIMKYAFSGGQPTIELHRKYGGNPDIDVSFQYLYMFFEPDDQKIKKIEEEYRSGKLLTGGAEGDPVEKLNEFLETHRLRREEAKSLVDKYMYDGDWPGRMWRKIHE